MTIAEAKQLRIVDYLASLGYHPPECNIETILVFVAATQ